MTITILEPKITIPQTESSPIRETDTKPVLKTDREFADQSGISLWLLDYEGRTQLSVFVFPPEYFVNSERILALDSNFSNVAPRIKTCIYKLPYDELDQKFMREAGVCASFYDHTYDVLGSKRVYEHSFIIGARPFLEVIIKDIK